MDLDEETINIEYGRGSEVSIREGAKGIRTGSYDPEHIHTNKKDLLAVKFADNMDGRTVFVDRSDFEYLIEYDVRDIGLKEK